MKRILIRILALALVLLMTTVGVLGSEWSDPLAVERQVYAYLTEELKLSSAAACGILANIEYESAFQLTILGDQGTSFGLCQWHDGRYAALKSYCTARGLDYRTVTGQMEYLSYELKSGYTTLYGALRSVDNSAEGAYRAGYLWCIQFERPANMEVKAHERGNSAKYKYWNRYNSIVILATDEPEPEPEEIVESLIRDEPPVTTPHRAEYVEVENQGRRYVAEKPEKRYYVNWHTPRVFPLSQCANGISMGFLFVMMGDGVDRRWHLPEPEWQELPDQPDPV